MILDGETTKMKVVVFEKLYNFIVEILPSKKTKFLNVSKNWWPSDVVSEDDLLI